MHYSLMGEIRLPFVDSDFLFYIIEVPFKAGLTVF